MKPVCLVLALLLLPTDLRGQDPQGLVQAPNTWVKRSPVPGGPRNPMLGYEASFGYDPVGKKIIRWGDIPRVADMSSLTKPGPTIRSPPSSSFRKPTPLPPVSVAPSKMCSIR